MMSTIDSTISTATPTNGYFSGYYLRRLGDDPDQTGNSIYQIIVPITTATTTTRTIEANDSMIDRLVNSGTDSDDSTTDTTGDEIATTTETVTEYLAPDEAAIVMCLPLRRVARREAGYVGIIAPAENAVYSSNSPLSDTGDTTTDNDTGDDTPTDSEQNAN